MNPVEKAQSLLVEWSDILYNKSFKELKRVDQMAVKNAAMFSLLQTLKVINYDLNGIEGKHYNVSNYYDSVFLELSKHRINE